MAPDASGGRTRLKIAVIGTGISGMAAAWLLSQRHDVTVYESEGRIGGHTNTIQVPSPSGPVPVDTGFIVYNEINYPNLVALFRHLNVPTRPTTMSFSMSIDDGALEYGGEDYRALFAQRRNLLRPRFWSMLKGIKRFYGKAASDIGDADSISLGDYLDHRGYSSAFQEDHLLPMAAAIWSSPMSHIRDYPAAAFIRFFDNHGLLSLTERPIWRTVIGGSSSYVERLTATYTDKVRLGSGVVSVTRTGRGVVVQDKSGENEWYDHAVISAHADQALGMLADPSPGERALLGAIPYRPNSYFLHTDESLMPRRRAVWSSWNYLAKRKRGNEADLCVTYWMNCLQGLRAPEDYFVTLNPLKQPRDECVISNGSYDHPSFDMRAMQAQKQLWTLQGQHNTWFCGAYFGAGFHEDGLQSGLAVAEALGEVRRPWSVPNESGRIHLGASRVPQAMLEAAE